MKIYMSYQISGVITLNHTCMQTKTLTLNLTHRADHCTILLLVRSLILTHHADHCTVLLLTLSLNHRADPDSICYQMLKNLPEISLDTLLRVFNDLWVTGNFLSLPR